MKQTATPHHTSFPSASIVVLGPFLTERFPPRFSRFVFVNFVSGYGGVLSQFVIFHRPGKVANCCEHSNIWGKISKIPKKKKNARKKLRKIRKFRTKISSIRTALSACKCTRVHTIASYDFMNLLHAIARKKIIAC